MVAGGVVSRLVRQVARFPMLGAIVDEMIDVASALVASIERDVSIHLLPTLPACRIAARYVVHVPLLL